MTYIGTSISRVDGPAKVTGAAKYAGDAAASDLAYGAVVTSTIAKGRIATIDTSAALRIAGVLDVLTHENRPRMARKTAAYKDFVAPEQGSPFRPLYDDKIMFSGQPIALALAEDWETARFAATLVRVEYEAAPFATNLQVERERAVAVGQLYKLPADADKAFVAIAESIEQPHKPRGNADKAYAAAAVRHEAEYFIPIEHHNPIELYASTVLWEDGKLIVYDKTQGVQNVRDYLCGVFDMKHDALRVLSPFMGGGFGSGLRPQYQVALAVLAARALKRSVRLVLTRQQMFALCYRPASIERLALGAQPGGTLDSVAHETIAVTSQYEDFVRNDTGWSGLLYKSPNARYLHRLAHVDLPTPSDMRAPGAATGVYGLECAMDELAVALKLDPLELRLRCYSDRDQHEDLPYTSKKLRECYRQGAAAFGWDRRSAEPRSMRDGSELVGWGMASGVWDAWQVDTAARILLTANGHAEVASACSDIGTGTRTIMAQVAADLLGLPLEAVTVRLGDSTLPQAPVEGGSWLAASVSHAIAKTADAIRKELWGLARAMPNSPLAGSRLEDIALTDGRIIDKKGNGGGVPITDAMRHGRRDRLEHETTNSFPEDKKHARNTHSAIFAEVKVDEELGVVRVTRVVSAVAAGRILNTKTARSQIMGAVVGGIGMALHEETLVDHTLGRMMNANIAEYHVPVNADIHDIDVIFVDEPDEIINPLGIKGLGEIGIVGVAAAIANAIYHATGTRIRDLPITLDKLL
jgi:xanthine dehydrogenase YagR molybdenum-binding subunit